MMEFNQITSVFDVMDLKAVTDEKNIQEDNNIILKKNNNKIL